MTFLTRLLGHFSNRIPIYFLLCVDSYLLMDAVVDININWLGKKWILNYFWGWFKECLLHFWTTIHCACGKTSIRYNWRLSHDITSILRFALHRILWVKFEFRIVCCLFEVDHVTRCKVHVWKITWWRWSFYPILRLIWRRLLGDILVW